MRRLGYLDPAEAYRYRVTSSPDALNNALKSVDAIKGLIDVTGTNLLARCRIAIGSPFSAGIHGEEAANGVYTNSAAGWTWIGNTSRDQYYGVIFGLGIDRDPTSALGKTYPPRHRRRSRQGEIGRAHV